MGAAERLPEWLTEQEAADYCQCSLWALRRMMLAARGDSQARCWRGQDAADGGLPQSGVPRREWKRAMHTLNSPIPPDN